MLGLLCASADYCLIGLLLGILSKESGMGASLYENSLPTGPIAALPWRAVQTPSRSAILLTLGVAIPAACVAIGPLALLIAHLATDQAALALVTDRPGSAAIALFGLLAWLLVFGWPMAHVLATIGSSRHITVADDTVIVRDQKLLGRTTWSQPVAAYTGLAHRVTTSLSGTRHELILVHPTPARSILLATAAKIGQSEIDCAAQLLGCREIAAPAPYGLAKGREMDSVVDVGSGRLAAAN
jgi:hypothetical protein